MIRLNQRRAFLWVVALLCCGVGCSTPPPRVLTPEEIARQERKIGLFLEGDLEAQLPLSRDPDVEVFLRSVGQRLVQQMGRLSDSPIGTLLFKDPHHRARSYALPGIRVYFSTDLLRTVEYENELAGMIAVQLAYVESGAVVKRVSKTIDETGFTEKETDTWTESDIRKSISTRIDFFGPNGIFAYSRDEDVEAHRRAVQVLYRAGYDPRGVIAAFEKEMKGSDESRVLDAVREEMNAYPPLRNPVVRSEEFLKIKKRITRL